VHLSISGLIEGFAITTGDTLFIYYWPFFGNNHLPAVLGRLPAFAESPVRKRGDESEKGTSAGSAEDVKMSRGLLRRAASLPGFAAAGSPWDARNGIFPNAKQSG